jgi:hypothetical protein
MRPSEYVILYANAAAGQSSPVYEPEYQAVLDYWLSLSIALPSVAVRNKQNAVISGLKSEGIWATRDSFSLVGETVDQTLTDMKRLVQMTAVNSPSFTSMVGLLGNGTTSYVNSNYNPVTGSANYALNNASAGVYLTAVGSLASRVVLGNGNATSRIRLQPTVAGFVAIQANDIGFGASSLPTPTAPAYIAFNRASSGQRHTFVNGTKSAVQNTPSVAVQSLSVFLLADNVGFPGFYINSQFAMHHIGSAMTDAQHFAMNSIIGTYLS